MNSKIAVTKEEMKYIKKWLKQKYYDSCPFPIACSHASRICAIVSYQTFKGRQRKAYYSPCPCANYGPKEIVSRTKEALKTGKIYLRKADQKK